MKWLKCTRIFRARKAWQISQTLRYGELRKIKREKIYTHFSQYLGHIIVNLNIFNEINEIITDKNFPYYGVYFM